MNTEIIRIVADWCNRYNADRFEIIDDACPCVVEITTKTKQKYIIDTEIYNETSLVENTIMFCDRRKDKSNKAIWIETESIETISVTEQVEYYKSKMPRLLTKN